MGGFISNNLNSNNNNNFTSIINNQQEEQENSLIFISFQNFYNLNEFPRFPLDQKITTILKKKEIINSFIIYISHNWYQNTSQKNNKEVGIEIAEKEIAEKEEEEEVNYYSNSLKSITINSSSYNKQQNKRYIDNENNEKYDLCIEGIQKIIQQNTLNFENIYIWIDYGCINQNNYPEDSYKYLPLLIEYSDCLFTPIVDNEDFFYEETSFGPLIDYKSKSFQDESFGYLSRAWCRLEMFFSANIPIKNSLMRDNFINRMKVAVLDGRRPHFIYGSKESAELLNPIELNYLDNVSYDKLNPLKGKYTFPNDQSKIEELVLSQLLPLMRTIKPGYFGSRNHLYQKHGIGKFIDSNGDIYEGEWYESRKQGKGKMQWKNGDVYIGDWLQNIIEGKGIMKSINGDVYEGDWINGKRNGYGICKYNDGGKYEGQWLNNELNGYGIYIYPDGTKYEGNFINGFKEGKGIITFKSGDIYNGDWNGGYMDGYGEFIHFDGSYYQGEWKLDKKNGYGRYYYINGGIYEGNWKDNKKHGHGTLTYPNGGCYDGNWVLGKWKG